MAEFDSDLMGSAPSGAKIGVERPAILFRSECAADYVLPDYMGDVKRILRSACRVTPVSKFVSEGEVSFLSVVSFSILYLDSEDKLTEAAFAKDMEHNEKLSSECTDAGISFDPTAVSIRLSGPRKISAKALLSGEICITDMGISAKCEIPEGAEQRKSTIRVHASEFLMSDEREYAQMLCRLEDVGRDEVEAVALFCDCASCNADISEGDISVVGKVRVSAIMRVDGEVTHADCEVPIEASFKCDSEGDLYPAADIIVAEYKVDLNEEVDENGMMTTTAVVTVGAKVELKVNSNITLEVVNDAFVPSMKNECEFSSVNYKSAVGYHNDRIIKEFSVGGGEGGLADMLFAECTVPSYRVEKCNSGVAVSGEMAYLAIAVDNSGSVKVFKGEYPFEEEIKLPVTRKCGKLNHKLTVSAVKALINGEEISFSSELVLDMLELDERDEIVLESLVSSEMPCRKGRRITVYYPENNESAWSISKKYSMKLSDLLYANPNAFDTDMNAVAKRVITLD